MSKSISNPPSPSNTPTHDLPTLCLLSAVTWTWNLSKSISNPPSPSNTPTHDLSNLCLLSAVTWTWTLFKLVSIVWYTNPHLSSPSPPFTTFHYPYKQPPWGVLITLRGVLITLWGVKVKLLVPVWFLDLPRNASIPLMIPQGLICTPLIMKNCYIGL